MIVALAGGVGGARLAAGLAALLPPASLLVVVNTADDFTHLGLHVSPDLDTVMYTLAGRANPEQGWGLAGETWSFMEALATLGGETWFRLGDRDLATHVERTRRLAAGAKLTEVTRALCGGYGVTHAIVPMSDDPVRTLVDTDEGVLAFQHYFVRRRCEPTLRALAYDGAARARPSARLDALLQAGARTARARAAEAPAAGARGAGARGAGARGAGARDGGATGGELEAVVLCPSNPWLSIEPILSLPGVRERLAGLRVPRVAVSPIIGGAAVKGPAAKIMRELGREVSAAGVAEHYGALVDHWVIDRRDAALQARIERGGARVLVTDTLMDGPEGQRRLAGEVLAFASGAHR